MLKYLMLFFIINFIFIKNADAHPHVFIDYEVNINASKDTLKNIDFIWKFDDITSSYMFEDFDKNLNKKFEKNELEEMKKVTLGNLKKFDYFIYLKVDNKNFKVKLDRFTVLQEDEIIIYKFSVPVNSNLKKTQMISLTMLDKTNYVAFSPEVIDPVNFKIPSNLKYDLDLKKLDSTGDISFKLMR